MSVCLSVTMLNLWRVGRFGFSDVYECDALGRTVKVSAFKTVINPSDPTKDQYQIFEHLFPDDDDHICAPSGYGDYVDKCK